MQKKSQMFQMVIAILAFILFLLWIESIHQDFPTLETATASVLAKHAECRDQLHVMKHVERALIGPAVFPYVPQWFLKCDVANITVRIQDQPDQ